MGYDYLPGELLREAPGLMSYHLYPLVQKIALWQLEPLQFKGGRLATLFKKGTSTEAENYRAILVSSSLGKCFHNLWRKRSLPWMRAMADPMQISATSGALVAQAAHVIRLHLGQGKTNGVSCFAVFLDIQSAYNRLLRQHSMDLDLSDLGIMTLIQRLGLHDLDFDAVAKALQEPSTLSQIDCPGHLHCMISLFHSQTWFILADDDRLVTTHRGTRPGDGFRRRSMEFDILKVPPQGIYSTGCNRCLSALAMEWLPRTFVCKRGPNGTIFHHYLGGRYSSHGMDS